VKKDFEDAIRGCLVHTLLGLHERTPSWEGADVFSVWDVRPFPKSLTVAFTALNPSACALCRSLLAERLLGRRVKARMPG